MANFPGVDTLYLITDAPVLDGNGQPVRDELLKVETAESVVRVEGCVFELQITVTPEAYEQVGVTTNTSDVRWAFLPVVDGQVPGFDVNGDAVRVNPPASDMRVRYQGRDWQIRGDAAIEVDLDGIEDHIFVMCERQTG
ncbi:hypothetical protein A5656_05605 [Mycobacterium gordonae]|nr:hypothetical protein [Mycobacterium gordonae]OBK44708.1 hypothetical protein A5656_05605 [Mycobacterium gordonae]